MGDKLLALNDISYIFDSNDSSIRGVKSVGFELFRGETLGLVGESGSGKSTLGKLILGILKPHGGTIDYFNSEGEKIPISQFRGQMIFQDPYSSLDPRMRVGDIVAEGLDIERGLLRHLMGEKEEEYMKRTVKIKSLLNMVGLSEESANLFPHHFSGGQRQRIGIARALAIEPNFIVCDEPLSSLDVSIQSQIINLLGDLQRDLGLTYLLISHDLNVVGHLADRIAVMHKGKIVEIGETDQVIGNPKHHYTKQLLESSNVFKFNN